MVVVVAWNTEGAYGASEGLPMKQGAPISPSFTISSGGQNVDDCHYVWHEDKSDDKADDDDDGGWVLVVTNLCLSHLAFTDDQRRKQDYIWSSRLWTMRGSNMMMMMLTMMVMAFTLMMDDDDYHEVGWCSLITGCNCILWRSFVTKRWRWKVWLSLLSQWWS